VVREGNAYAEQREGEHDFGKPRLPRRKGKKRKKAIRAGSVASEYLTRASGPSVYQSVRHHQKKAVGQKLAMGGCCGRGVGALHLKGKFVGLRGGDTFL